MRDKERNILKVGTYTTQEGDPIIFPQKRFVFGEEADEYLTKLLKDKLENNEEVPEVLCKIFLKRES